MVGDSKPVWACELMVCVLWWTRDLTRVFTYLSPDDRCVWLNAGVCGGSSHGAGEGRLKPELCQAGGKVRRSCRRGADLLQVRDRHWFILLRTHAWLILLLLFFYESGIKKEQLLRTPDFIWAQKDLDVPEFFPFFRQTGANQFPLACCLRVIEYLRSVCAWQIVTHQHTRLQNCSPCLFFYFILCILSITEFPKGRIS